MATLRWYEANETGPDFSISSAPRAVAFDGTNIWVANGVTNNVTKLRTSDGFVLGTFPVGIQPVGVAFDGANIWVSNSGTNDLTKLRASDGANLGSFAVGNDPTGVAFPTHGLRRGLKSCAPLGLPEHSGKQYSNYEIALAIILACS